MSREYRLQSKSIFDFLGEVFVNLERSEMAYANYINGKKIFLHAKNLKLCNLRIRDLLLENCHLLSEDLCKDSLELILHYDVWIIKWEELEKELSPKLDDEFIFQNDFTFPRSASENLKTEFVRLRKG